MKRTRGKSKSGVPSGRRTDEKKERKTVRGRCWTRTVSLTATVSAAVYLQVVGGDFGQKFPQPEQLKANVAHASHMGVFTHQRSHSACLWESGQLAANGLAQGGLVQTLTTPQRSRLLLRISILHIKTVEY